MINFSSPGTIIICILALILIVLAIILLIGKGDWMISGYNNASNKKKARFDIMRLRLITAMILLVGTVYMLLLILLIDNVIASVILNVSFFVFVIISVIVANTWAKK